MPFLSTAFSSNSRCFICRRRNGRGVRLHKVKLESVLKAYSTFRFVIKLHARCCLNHMDENRLIRDDVFPNIQTRLVYYDNETKRRLDAMIKNRYSKKIGIFEQFNNTQSLTEDHCMKITGWTKAQFVEFSRQIVNINKTKHRKKNELIALYRYWLRKGMNQQSLAFYGETWTQRSISRYLNQIRKAINEQFVPRYLGAASRDREFFISHNTETSRVLYNLDENNLVLIGDGTYCRIEKSADNAFQYNTYSQHKKDNLIKPFVLICADGYFIDVYGAYPAKLNDATILRHIIEYDVHLRNIARPNETTFVLDRGKYLILKNIYFHLKLKIFS